MISDPATRAQPGDGRIPVLYLAPWVDYGGSDKGTIDWFRWLDRDRFAPSLITTQPSENRRLAEIEPYAEEVWALPEHFSAPAFPHFIFDFIYSRGVRVLHIMNSRLAYDLLPELAALPAPPKAVVQLHVEEPDRSGYVRYVATRYGNLVDGFSVTSEHLARGMSDYDIPRSRVHVIPTGVDALGEFDPGRIAPWPTAGDERAFRILVPGRLADQKDPLLALEVVRRLAVRRDDIQVDFVGDGPLGDALRVRIDELGMSEIATLHPPSEDLARWMRSSDLLLMTSVFEGVPYVVYEAAAMGLPVVAPALPGNVELLEGTGGLLIADRTDVEAYVEALDALLADTARARSLGASARTRMLERFSLRGMAAGHEALYERLLEDAAASGAIGAGGGTDVSSLLDAPPAPLPAPLRLTDRPVSGTPPVSIVTPCFNHGRYLAGFLAAVEAQDYPELECIIVDDGSTDPETTEALRAAEEAGRARVIRQKRNRGPSVARNRAIAEASGRYILPVDADNLLLPGAVRSLVNQLQSAGERVGFIYPGFQYFGTRDYQFDPPAYNLFLLLHANYADTCSLIDRAVFDAGLEYAEDILLGHEDWDFVLALAARDIVGEPSREPVMLYRKQGFTRSDLVEYLKRPFHGEIADRHPALFGRERDHGAWGRFRGPALQIKAAWNPGVSVIITEPVDFETEFGARLLRGFEAQSCGDLELVVECPRLPETPLSVRRLPAGLAADGPERLQAGLTISNGRYLLVTSAPAALAAGRSTIETLIRGLAVDDELDATVLADLGAAESRRFRPVAQVAPDAEAHTVVYDRELHRRLPREVLVQDRREPGDLAEAIARVGTVRWRHLTGDAVRGSAVGTEGVVRLGHALVSSPAVCDERALRFGHAPALPSAPIDVVPRWAHLPSWMPPETLHLVRHRRGAGEQRVIDNSRNPPRGFQIEFDIGAIQHFSPPGTLRLVNRDGRFLTAPRGSERLDGDTVLGYLEEAPLPGFAGVLRARLPDGTETLVLDSDRDPLRGQVQDVEFLGFVETFPISPVRGPAYTAVRQRSLVRYLDTGARCHRYAAPLTANELDGSLDLSAELGRLAGRSGPGRRRLLLDEHGHLRTDDGGPSTRPAPGALRALRWAGAPAQWRRFGHRSARPRAVARRLLDVAAVRGFALGPATGPQGPPPGEPSPLGYLERVGGSGRLELFSAWHPVLRDQFVTTDAREATDLGYVEVMSLGFLEAVPSLTGVLGGHRHPVPWASRFGLPLI